MDLIELRTAHTADLDADTKVRSAYQLVALGASAEGNCLYVARGWQLRQGPPAA